MEKNVAMALAHEAMRKGICKEWYNELKRLTDKRAMVEMYVKGIDFCLSNDYPNNDFIQANFKGIMEDYGVYLDDTVALSNPKRCVALGMTNGTVEVSKYGVCVMFAKHQSRLTLSAKDDAFVIVDLFDNSELNIHAHDRAKVCVNRYGGTLNVEQSDSARVKVIEKLKKTY